MNVTNLFRTVVNKVIKITMNEVWTLRRLQCNAKECA